MLADVRDFLIFLCLLLAVAGPTVGFPLQRRQEQCSASNLTVDLGYSIYEGYDAGNGLNAWTGIRYAAPPTGALRWKAPSPPVTYRKSVLHAKLNPNLFTCPQSSQSPYIGDTCGDLTNATTLPSSCSKHFHLEDCLFLNVYSPQDAQSLPVFVFIHGGGYATGNGAYDVASLISSNESPFVAVTIQYRLGPFGFLSSSYMNKQGTLNAGLQDQQFALKWVQDNICQFGGDPSKVTVTGESSGAGSVLAHVLAEGGTLKNTYFRNAIAISPYVPAIYGYQDPVPTYYFNAFAREVGCNSPATAISCLRKKNTLVLQLAAKRISGSAAYGTWAFMPVTDGKFYTQSPAAQLSTGKLNGERMLTGSSAIEGSIFVPQNITSDSEFASYAQRTFPNVDYDELVANYPSPGYSDDTKSPLFASAGDTSPTAMTQSSVATGHQQRANNLYSEATFVCPSYWIADAFTRVGLPSYKYQFSVPPAAHMFDLVAYFDPLPLNGYINRDFQLATMQTLGSFTVNNNPSISNEVANGRSRSDKSNNPASNWPLWTLSNPQMMNMNLTNGTASNTFLTQRLFATYGIPYSKDPGLMNDFRIVDASPWEGGRGARCDFWKNQAPNIPV